MIKIGTSGSSFDDCKKSIYPAGLAKDKWLSFYEQELGFSALEVNFTYYSLPSAKSFEGMSRKTSADFSFVVKAYRGMTHDIRDRTTKKILDNKDVFEKFLFSLGPIITDKKLSCILMQFPFSFHPTQQNADYLNAARDRLGDIPVVVEFRNHGWHKEKTFDFLQKNDMGYCAVDEPPLEGLMPFAPRATSAIGYFRLHGRNRNWFNAPVSERYNYLYSEEELKEFLPPIRGLSAKTGTLFVFFNNCHAGSAAKNAVMLAKMLLEPGA